MLEGKVNLEEIGLILSLCTGTTVISRIPDKLPFHIKVYHLGYVCV